MRARSIAAAAIVFVAAGCARGDAPTTASASAGGSAGSTSADAPMAVIGTVSSVGVGPDGSTLLIGIGSIPDAPAGDHCAAKIDVSAYPKPEEIVLSIGVTSDGTDLAQCGPLTGRREVPVALGEPTSGRPVSFNVTGMPERYVPSGTDGYVACVAPGCDPTAPIAEPGTCENLREAAGQADAPKNFDMVDVRCDAGFAVYGLDFGSGGCAPGDGAPRVCAGRLVHRIYWRSTPTGWVILAWDDGPGCRHVLEAAPDFPTALCADLPELPANR